MATVGAGLEAFCDLLAGGDVLVLSGAGISTESGIPDYRGPDGERRVTPMLHRDFCGSSEARQTYWARAYVGWRNFSSAGPNAGHDAVARLQAAGLVGPVITQNVDGLHQRAGTEDVCELHGALADVVCLTCGDRTSRWDLDERMQRDNPGFGVHTGEIRPDGDVTLEAVAVAGFVVPLCERCGNDTLKPDVVFFGDQVPKPRVEHCFDLTDRCSALVVLGSSLAVYSGYRFVKRAAANDTPVAIVTRGATRGDREARVRVDAQLGPTLSAAVERLGV